MRDIVVQSSITANVTTDYRGGRIDGENIGKCGIEGRSARNVNCDRSIRPSAAGIRWGASGLIRAMPIGTRSMS